MDGFLSWSSFPDCTNTPWITVKQCAEFASPLHLLFIDFDESAANCFNQRTLYFTTSSIIFIRRRAIVRQQFKPRVHRGGWLIELTLQNTSKVFPTPPKGVRYSPRTSIMVSWVSRMLTFSNPFTIPKERFISCAQHGPCLKWGTAKEMSEAFCLISATLTMPIVVYADSGSMARYRPL